MGVIQNGSAFTAFGADRRGQSFKPVVSVGEELPPTGAKVTEKTRVRGRSETVLHAVACADVQSPAVVATDVPL